MKGKQLSEAISAYANALHAADCGHQAAALRLFASAFEAAGSATENALIERAEMHWASGKKAPDYPLSLKSAIHSLGLVLMASGAKKQAESFQSLARLFKGNPTGDAASFTESMKTAMAAVKAPRGNGRGATSNRAASATIRSEYLAKFTKNLTNYEAASRLLKELETDTTITDTDVKAIGKSLTAKGRGSREAALSDMSTFLKSKALDHKRRRELSTTGV
jgi:hypothetical protein